MRFDGVITALATPFRKGRLDKASLKRLVRWQLENSVSGFVVNGTTAESPCLSDEEVEQIFRLVRLETGKGFPLILGVGSNSTAQTIANLKLSKKLRADAVLAVVPYYNKPTQAGLLAHFRAVAEASSSPVILYNVPGRTIVSLEADTIGKLSRHSQIVGVKEASGDMRLLRGIRRKTSSRFLLSSGDDSTCMNFCLKGGHGVTSVISHLIPAEMADLTMRASSGDRNVFHEYNKFDRLNRLLASEPNPTPVKMGLKLMGIFGSAEMRLPLLPMTSKNTKLLKSELNKLGLI